MQYSDKYLALCGKWPKRIPHWEHWSNPDAETYLTGIDYYDHPQACRKRLMELYPMLELPIPADDTPKPRPRLDGAGNSADREAGTVRWGDSTTATFHHGDAFQTEDDVFNFSPLEHADFRQWPQVVEAFDFSNEDNIYRSARAAFPAEWGDKAPEGSTASAAFYNTMFMWPVLTFGWEMFLTCCLDERFERIMDEFAELNRRVFRAYARLPVEFIVCHDDITGTRGPFCSPAWMHKYIFPRYEEFWSILHAAGKKVIFVSDGKIDAYADDVMACGAQGISTEPYTDFKRIARNYPDAVLLGEGDNRILMSKDPDAIRHMVEQMVETAHLSGGYMMSIGNHIPWNVPPESVKLYLDLCAELAWR